jgi:hypothetical protein
MAGGGIVVGPQRGAGVVASWNGLTWSPVHVVLPNLANEDQTQISSMSCSNPSFCVAADQNQRTLQWNGTRWHLRKFVGQYDSFESFTFSCTSKTFCMGLGSLTDQVVAWNGRTWKTSEISPGLPVNGFGMIGCLSTRDCVAVDESGNASRWNGRLWTNAQATDHATQDFVQGLSCSTAGFCEAVTSKDHFLYLYDPRKVPNLPVPCSVFRCGATVE